jgi:hypothetical protein
LLKPFYMRHYLTCYLLQFLALATQFLAFLFLS